LAWRNSHSSIIVVSASHSCYTTHTTTSNKIENNNENNLQHSYTDPSLPPKHKERKYWLTRHQEDEFREAKGMAKEEKSLCISLLQYTQQQEQKQKPQLCRSHR
jgi:hypothetical protein